MLGAAEVKVGLDRAERLQHFWPRPPERETGKITGQAPTEVPTVHRTGASDGRAPHDRQGMTVPAGKLTKISSHQTAGSTDRQLCYVGGLCG
ncbi:hypothetical protein MMIN_10460 [Mycolicibacter minnesotensis]|nr:hypothetical protein MMIN_10460 [Mycolicibacter minnesotensis]